MLHTTPSFHHPHQAGHQQWQGINMGGNSTVEQHIYYPMPIPPMSQYPHMSMGTGTSPYHQPQVNMGTYGYGTNGHIQQTGFTGGVNPPLPQTHNPLSQVHSQLSQVHNPLSQVHSQLSQVHSQLSQVPLSQFHSPKPKAESQSSSNDSYTGLPRPPLQQPRVPMSPYEKKQLEIQYAMTLLQTQEPTLRKCSRCRCTMCLNKLESNGKKQQHACHMPGCRKVYSKTSHLKAHLRLHAGSRPFVCPYLVCSRAFTRSDELQRHIRIHTGEKNFVCDICSKRFMRSDHLAKHIRTHEKNKTVENINQTVPKALESPSSLPDSSSCSSDVSLPGNVSEDLIIDDSSPLKVLEDLYSNPDSC